MDKIDFVISWVDDKDPIWKEEKKKYQDMNKQPNDARISRYRDWDNLRYWFRGVEKFAPWVNKIYFVTWGHLPRWLNTHHPKLKIVTHNEYIPHKYLPTFSSRPIELNLHRICGLSNQFVYFNDDMFLISPTKETDFFVDGMPCNSALLSPCFISGKDGNGESTPFSTSYIVGFFDMAIINRHFDKRKSFKNNFFKWFNIKYGVQNLRNIILFPWKLFPGFTNLHVPYSFLKEMYEEVWEKESELLDTTCTHKFRDITDINAWLISYWQMVSGKFSPRSPYIGISVALSDNMQQNAKILRKIKAERYKMICINDEISNQMVFQKIKNNVVKFFNELLPEKSGFEIRDDSKVPV